MNPDGQPWCARSDPRMNRAVEARLQNPSLSLYECLRRGGFEYINDEANAMDDENVTLAQRKNQLNRRLRSYRQRLSKAKAKASSMRSQLQGTGTTNCAGETKSEPFDEDTRFLEVNLSGGEEAKIPAAEDQNANTSSNDAFTTLFQGGNNPLSNLIESLGFRGGEPSPAFSSSQPIVPPRHDPAMTDARRDQHAQLSGNGSSNTMPSRPAQNQQVYSSPAPSVSTGLGSTFDLEAVLQLALRASSATGQQHHQHQHQHQHHQQQQQQAPQQQAPQQQAPQQQVPNDPLREIAARLIAHISGHSVSPEPTNTQAEFASQELARLLLDQIVPAPAQVANDPRQQLALRLFQQEMISIYARCLRNAGYSSQEIESNSAAYLEFLRVASQQEFQRVQRQLQSNTSTGGRDTWNDT